MKSKRIVYILFLTFCMVSVHTKAFNLDSDFLNDETQIDSLYSTYNTAGLTENNASKVIQWYQSKELNNLYLSNEDYKRIAL